jgi:hypothetical protein
MLATNYQSKEAGNKRVSKRVTYHSCETDKLDDDETTDSIENASWFPEAIVKDLGNRLHDWACEDFSGITLGIWLKPADGIDMTLDTHHAERKHDVE